MSVAGALIELHAVRKELLRTAYDETQLHEQVSYALKGVNAAISKLQEENPCGRSTPRALQRKVGGTRQRAKYFRVNAKMTRNPSLVVYNPPDGMKVRRMGAQRIIGVIGERVYQVRYRHAEDLKDYFHDFDPGVKLIALDNGDVLLTSDKPLWEDFEE